MSAPRLRFGPDDRIVIRGVQRRWVQTIATGHIFVSVADPNMRETFSDVDLAFEMKRQDWAYERDAHSLANVRAVALSGVASVGEIPEGKERAMALWRLAWCECVEELQRKGEVSRSRSGLQKAISAIGPKLVEREFAKLAPTATGRLRRGGTPVVVFKPPSARTLLRWILQYERHGGRAIALRPAWRRSGDRTERFCPEVEVLLRRHVESYLDETRPTKAKCHGDLKATIDGVNRERVGRGLPELPVPSLKTVSARIAGLSAFEVCAARHGVEAATRKFAALGQGLDVTRAGERVEFDEWELPLMTLLVDLDLWLQMPQDMRDAVERLKIWVCVALDAASRAVLGVSFSRTARAENAIEALHMVLRDKAPFVDAVEASTPWNMTCTPETVVTDAGSSFIADAFRSRVLSVLSSPHVTIAGKPMLRARIERFFSTAHKQSIARFPGRTFANIVEKGDYKPETRAAATVAMACDALMRWIIDDYHNRPHRGLNGETPRNAWNRLVRQYGVNPPPGPNLCRHVFGLELTRVSGRHGVVVMGLNYQSEDLQAWRRQHGDMVLDVKVDPQDLGRISVRLGEAWHTCACMRPGFDGVHIAAWLAAAADLRDRFAAQAVIAEADMLAAVRAAMATSALSVGRFDLGSTRPGLAALEKAERETFIGFAMPATGEQPALFSDVIEGTAPTTKHDSAGAKPNRRKRSQTGRQPAKDAHASHRLIEDDPDDDEPISTFQPRIEYDD